MVADLAANAPETIDEMLKVGGEVLRSAQQDSIKRYMRSGRSIGTLAKSIEITTPNGAGVDRFVEVYPQGDQPHGSPRRGKKGRVPNAAVGFILEYGRSNMLARPWMQQAIEKSAERIHDAMWKVWEDQQ